MSRRGPHCGGRSKSRRSEAVERAPACEGVGINRYREVQLCSRLVFTKLCGMWTPLLKWRYTLAGSFRMQVPRGTLGRGSAEWRSAGRCGGREVRVRRRTAVCTVQREEGMCVPQREIVVSASKQVHEDGA